VFHGPTSTIWHVAVFPFARLASPGAVRLRRDCTASPTPQAGQVQGEKLCELDHHPKESEGPFSGQAVEYLAPVLLPRALEIGQEVSASFLRAPSGRRRPPAFVGLFLLPFLAIDVSGLAAPPLVQQLCRYFDDRNLLLRLRPRNGANGAMHRADRYSGPGGDRPDA
jgi:hypothetical protein